MTKVTIQSLHIHPVKSLRAVSLPEVDVDPTGLRHDRRWMVVGHDGEFLTQRRLARMATIGTEVRDDHLVLTHSETGELTVPLQPAGGPVRVKVWSDRLQAIEVGEEANAWLMSALQTPCRLVKMPESTVRKMNHFCGDGQITFTDAMPILVASQASLDLLNSKLEHPIPMDRFRANIVLAGCDPHAEDDWSEIVLGDVVLRKTKRCGRCLVTTTDHVTGERGIEPLATLATYRKHGTHVHFGCYYAPVKTGRVSLGDGVIASS
jgi:uncharacterized protein YcbX